MKTGNERSRGKKTNKPAEARAQPSTAPASAGGSERKRLSLKFGR